MYPGLEVGPDNVSYLLTHLFFFFFFSILLECTSNKFRCQNGFCVPNNTMCDGQNQCGDWSDEAAPECHQISKYRIAGNFRQKFVPQIFCPVLMIT